KLHPLNRHPALDRAAQAHAEAVLGVIRSGRPLVAAGPIAAKVKRQKYRMAGIVGERIVTDALNPEQALAELLDEGRGKSSTLLGEGFTEMGIGLAYERLPEGFRIVWVQCLARPVSKRTGTDAVQEPKEGSEWGASRNTPGGERAQGSGGEEDPP
ncbi:MAG TPA: hypothetical protein VNM67_24235, partial [Thermoanaerobaculia bacterium]|nr:hypothetical protein [Thermoanaerobaculia bacterium]